MRTEILGFSGGCYWCMEAMFRSLRGVTKVLPGWITPRDRVMVDSAMVDSVLVNGVLVESVLTESVLVWFDPDVIPIESLVAIHQLTHNSSSSHVRRSRYPSAVYVYHGEQYCAVEKALNELALQNDNRNHVQALQHRQASLSQPTAISAPVTLSSQIASSTRMVSPPRMASPARMLSMTQILMIRRFTSSDPGMHDYYYANPDRPFCNAYITPKLSRLLTHYRELVPDDKQTVIAAQQAIKNPKK